MTERTEDKEERKANRNVKCNSEFKKQCKNGPPGYRT